RFRRDGQPSSTDRRRIGAHNWCCIQIEKTGDRPSSATSTQLPIVQVTLEASRAFGVEAQLKNGSTDQNNPISMGIPAIAIGGGGSSGNIHTPEEWFDPTQRHLGIQRLLTIVATLAGLA